MARISLVEGFFLPLTSALMPIPSLAWAPVFILWFGLGNTVSILIVLYAALFPMLLNTWSGVRAVSPLWLRAAQAMGAGEQALFWKVIIPGAAPFIITGLRQALIRAWIAVIGAIGFMFERIVFGSLERATVLRWGMVRAVRE